ncbi:MAG: acyl-CoA dehydrogenase family protein [Lachnospiraceae bacterium]|jgi:alkylation response protein AidB-like acyl-CoA dehydrogenase|nr:acyl-CoA dehydrogenase family protein [Lachnospiraceae bacterium]
MATPNRNNPYNFDEFLELRDKIDYYADDEFAQKVVKYFAREDFDRVDKEVREMSKLASNSWRRTSDAIARPEERPYIVHYNGQHNRIDRIVRPANMLAMEKEVYGQAFFSKRTHQWTRITKQFLIHQNGETGLTCPIVCTEGIVEAIRKLGADRPEVEQILEHVAEGKDGDFAIGSQFITEIQGGSDVPSNCMEAIKQEDGSYRLYGTKYFCSACHADYSMVTAVPQGQEKPALFVMPMWLPGNKEKEIRNSYTIDHIKWKIGTCELPTCELTFNGSVAYAVGPLNKGVGNLVGIILTKSRLVVGLGSAADMARAQREARLYAGWRTAFEQPIGDFAMVANLLKKIEHAYKRTLAGAYKIYRDYEGSWGKDFIAKSEEHRRLNWVAREVVLMQKVTGAWDTTDVIRDAMSVFGGFGAIEEATSLPRLYRDSAVNELWEGPRNVLLAQMYRDIQNAEPWFPVHEFVGEVLKGWKQDEIDKFAKELKEIVDYGDLDKSDEKTMEMAARYDKFVGDFTHAYQELALANVEGRIKEDALLWR